MPEGAVGIDPTTLLWAIINFAVFFLLLRFVFYRPLLGMIEGRRQEIADSLAQAEAARDEAQRLLAEHKAQVARAEAEAREIMAKAAKAAEEVRERMLREAEEEYEKTIQRGKEAIDREREQALAQIRQEAATLTIMAAAKVINRTLSPEEHRRLAEEALEEVARQ